MKTALFLLFMLSFTVRPQTVETVFFSDSDRDDYYDPSWGFVEAPGELNLIEPGPKVAVETGEAFSGKNSLKLIWRSVPCRSWGVAIARQGWSGADLSEMDTLNIMLFSPAPMAPDDLPRVYLEDLNNLKTGKVRLGHFVESVPVGQWFPVKIAMAQFSEQRRQADLARIKTVFFGRNFSDKGPRTLLIDEVRFTGPPPPPGRKNVVVLGSSTAAGTGPQDYRNAWVNRFRDYAHGGDSSLHVVNLAIGGFTSYDIMPGNVAPPANRAQSRPGHNLDAALSYKPVLVLINLPSNDASSGFSIPEQIANFDTLVGRLSRLRIPVWVTTTQPRNFEKEEQRRNLMEMRDSLLVHYPRKFGAGVVDFWNGMAEEGGFLAPQFDSGDGIHVNDVGHGIFADRMIEAVFGKAKGVQK